MGEPVPVRGCLAVLLLLLSGRLISPAPGAVQFQGVQSEWHLEANARHELRTVERLHYKRIKICA